MRACSRRALEDGELERLIRRIFDESLQTYGAPRIHAELRDEHGIRVGKKRLARLMRKLAIEGVSAWQEAADDDHQPEGAAGARPGRA